MVFEGLLGNLRIKRILSAHLASGKLPSSMIFNGPDSADAYGFAFEFAKAANCLEEEHGVCNRCEFCSEANKGIFIDLQILSPEGQFYRKEQIVQLIEETVKRPLKGKHKIFILRKAHLMTESASNSFLKVLEEPPETVIFILITDNLRRMLPTVKSRCQIFPFAVIPTPDRIDHFLKMGFDREKAIVFSHLSLIDAKYLSGQELDGLLEKRLDYFSYLSRLIRGRGIEKVMLELNSLTRNREAFLHYFRDLIKLLLIMLRDIMVLKVDRTGHAVINVDLKEKLLGLSEYIDVKRLFFLSERMEKIAADVERNLNAKVLVLEFLSGFSQEEVNDV